jgi:hypothetical protein
VFTLKVSYAVPILVFFFVRLCLSGKNSTYIFATILKLLVDIFLFNLGSNIKAEIQLSGTRIFRE